MSRLMLCGLMSWVILCSFAPVRADDAEDKAVKLVENLGGRVTRDDTAPGKPVIRLDLYDRPVTGAELKELAGLKDLTTLGLYRMKLTDAGIKELAAFTNLTTLDLQGTEVTEVGLKELAGPKKLTALDLGRMRLSDAGIKEVAALTNLTNLSLRKSVTDAELKGLAGLGATLANLLQAHADFTHAKMEVYNTPESRLAALKALVAATAEMENDVRAKSAVGAYGGSTRELCTALAARLHAEERLLREMMAQRELPKR